MRLHPALVLAIVAWCATACIPSRPAIAAPPGFRVVQITNTTKDIEFNPRINNRAHVVWSSRIGNKELSEEIYLYAGGVTTRITSNSIHERLADINDKDTVVWSRFDGPEGPYGPTAEIVKWSNGVTDYITDDAGDDYGPSINSHGHIAWNKWVFRGCVEANCIVQYYDGEGIADITSGEHSDQTVWLSESNEVIWGRYRFCDSPWHCDIMGFANGQVTRLSDGTKAFGPRLSQSGLVAWSQDDGLYVLQDEQISRITDDGIGPWINSRGDIAFIRWNDETDLWESWLYLGGEFRLLARSDRWEIAYDINERGDIVFQSCTAALDKSEIVLFLRLPDGDMNCDERVDFDDIDGFVSAITSRAQYEEDHPDCDWWLADMSGNRSVDFDDIDGFVNCLVDGGCERQ